MIEKAVQRSLQLLAFLILLGVSGQAATAQQRQAPLPQETVVIKSGESLHRFEAEVASTDRQRARGLMFREEMAADHGMLFVFEGEGERYFWMKNTPLPLDIIYIAKTGRIVSIAKDTTPFSEVAIPSGQPAEFVLELNAGITSKLGIGPGDTVSSPSIDRE
ncbi:DUF192 domain-containing protein [Roseibium aggregatum]|uniref:DUF192 domain-containing protein n=1 Tax=Roseibium aggregatum TaxID=187304 RepID=A0A939EBP9_9HYPH|nr:DUF192 domain-containing protein [Roseibium aggregatum]MBN9670396.1 DUF192 domain-containing protein [Roseibium aggregatum]